MIVGGVVITADNDSSRRCRASEFCSKSTADTAEKLSKPFQPIIRIKVNLAQPRQKLHIISRLEQRIDVPDMLPRRRHMMMGRRRGYRDSRRRQQAIEDFPQSHHAEFANAAVAVVHADGFESGCQHA